MKITRRHFFKTSSGTVAASVLPLNALPITIDKEKTDQATDNNLEIIKGLTRDRPAETRKGDMVYRQLGSTGVEVSIIGMGGYHLGKTSDPGAAIQFIRTAIDHGISFMDNCWDYNLGRERDSPRESIAGRLPKSGFSHDKNRRENEKRRLSTNRRIAPSTTNRSSRPAAASRSDSSR
jgi:hypothetical protein